MKLQSLIPFAQQSLISDFRVSNQLHELYWEFKFSLIGDLRKVQLPLPVNHSERRNELWKSTCFEVFAQLGSSEYIELNISPEGHWNCYEFTSYRNGMHESALVRNIDFKLETQDSSHYSCLIKIWLQKPLRPHLMGLTSVIKTQSEGLQYWSLRHSGDKADFHRSEDWLITFDATRDTL